MTAAISVYRVPDVHRRWSLANDLLFDTATADGVGSVEDALRRCLDDCLHSEPVHRITVDADPAELRRLRPVLDRLLEEGPNPSLAELAALVGMSRYQLIRVMKRATGLAPLA